MSLPLSTMLTQRSQPGSVTLNQGGGTTPVPPLGNRCRDMCFAIGRALKAWPLRLLHNVEGVA
jgi:hypothetical protein